MDHLGALHNLRRKLLIAIEASALTVLLFAIPLHGQNRTVFAAARNAYDYAFGVTPGSPALQVSPGGGVTVTGTGTLTLVFGYTNAADGTIFYPLNVNAPITVGSGTNADTVTPTAVSCTTPAIYATCQVTASFNHTHGTGDIVTTGSIGLQEAINLQQSFGGGRVIVTPTWSASGGTNAIVAAAAPFSSVFIEDMRGQNGTFAPGSLYWTMQPTTLSSIAAPAVLTATTAVFSGTGTWTAADQFLCITYVDALGGEGPCSPTYDVTPSASVSLTITSPVASTGAVGWRAYGGASYNGAYLLPVNSIACSLATLETVMPACAIGANGTWAAIFVSTTTLRPNAQTTPTVNLNLPFPQGHTTFGYQPSGLPGEIFQTHYGPFPAFGSTTSGQLDILGSANLPPGFLNYIGRTVRISGKIALTANTAAVPTFTVGIAWAGGLTSGAPIAVCTYVGAAYGSSVAFNVPFSCTVTTNAIGATAVGTVMTDGWLAYGPAAGAAGAVHLEDTATAAIGSLGLFSQNTIYVKYLSGTNTTSAAQLLDLHVETLQ